MLCFCQNIVNYTVITEHDSLPILKYPLCHYIKEKSCNSTKIAIFCVASWQLLFSPHTPQSEKNRQPPFPPPVSLSVCFPTHCATQMHKTEHHSTHFLPFYLKSPINHGLTLWYALNWLYGMCSQAQQTIQCAKIQYTITASEYAGLLHLDGICVVWSHWLKHEMSSFHPWTLMADTNDSLFGTTLRLVGRLLQHLHKESVNGSVSYQLKEEEMFQTLEADRTKSREAK